MFADPAGEANYTFEDQRCGGHVNTSTGGMSSYIPQGSVYPASYAPKGFICPAGQLCMVSIRRPRPSSRVKD